MFLLSDQFFNADIGLPQRNLVENGGILDEVIFVAKTDNEDDLSYLEQLIQSSDKFSAEYHNEKGLDFSQMYSACKRGNIYVKIDDDVVRSMSLYRVAYRKLTILSSSSKTQLFDPSSRKKSHTRNGSWFPRT